MSGRARGAAPGVWLLGGRSGGWPAARREHRARRGSEAADGLGATVDDLDCVVQIVEVAPQGVEQLVEGFQRGALAARLVGRQHALRDACEVCHLVLLARLPFTQPAESLAEAAKCGWFHDTGLHQTLSHRSQGGTERITVRTSRFVLSVASLSLGVSEA